MTYEEFKQRYDFNMRDPECILGNGGFGKVFKAYDTLQDRYVAIKRSEVKPEFKQFTLMREVELANAIPAHPNIAQYETCYRFESMDAEVDFAVLHYYEHGNISQLVSNNRLNDLEKRQLVKGILRGMVHLHSQGFIHRDIKGGNVLVSREQGVWQPKIADFGLSKEVQNETETRSVFNSAIGVSYHYAAPEQITGASKILPNVDLWAVGVLIYQILTGEFPFYSDNPDTTINQNEVAKKVTEIEIPTKLNSIPEPYQSIIKECWVKDPKERVQKAETLLEKLGEEYRQVTSDSKEKIEKPIVSKKSTEESSHTDNKINDDETKIEPSLSKQNKKTTNSSYVDYNNKSKKSLQTALILGSSSAFLIMFNRVVFTDRIVSTESSGLVLLSLVLGILVILLGILGLIFTIRANKRIKRFQVLDASRRVKRILYLSYLLSCLWFILFVIAVIFSGGISTF